MMQPLLARTWLAQLERAYDRGEVEKGVYRNMRRTLVRAALGETGARSESDLDEDEAV